MPMIAITIINSMRVKPFCNDFMETPGQLKVSKHYGR
jgi:hypothetical protein